MTIDDQEPEPRNVVLLTADEVAEILKLKSRRAVYKLSARHGWTFQRTISRTCVRYERRALLQWIRRRPTHWKRLKPASRDDSNGH